MHFDGRIGRMPQTFTWNKWDDNNWNLYKMKAGGSGKQLFVSLTRDKKSIPAQLTKKSHFLKSSYSEASFNQHLWLRYYIIFFFSCFTQEILRAASQ